MSSFEADAALKRRQRRAQATTLVLALGTIAVTLPLLTVFGVLLSRALPALSWSFLWSNPEHGMTAGGIFPAIVGTVWLVTLSTIIACPVGVLAAIYLCEYAKENRLTSLVQLAILNLAGVPSIVYALFGLGAFVLFLDLGTSILAASLTLAVMNLPVVITATSESLRAVPHAFREAAWNVGASRWQTIWRVVLPNALPGILTGIVLTVSRAAGETAPILFTGAAFYVPQLPTSWFDQCMALAMHLFTLSTQVTHVPDAYPYATAVVLIGVVLSANAVSITLRVRSRARRKW